MKNINEDIRPFIAAAALGLSPISTKAQEITPSPEKLEYKSLEIPKGVVKKTEIKKNDTYNIDDLVNAIIKHEKLIDYQTPFRITALEMNNWKTIHGFDIDTNFKKPENRKNFIFLKNKEDVPKAIKKQLQKYVSNPSKYELPSNPTIKDIINTFDHTNSEGKLKLLSKDLKGFNSEQLASEIIKENFHNVIQILLEEYSND